MLFHFSTAQWLPGTEKSISFLPAEWFPLAVAILYGYTVAGLTVSREITLEHVCLDYIFPPSEKAWDKLFWMEGVCWTGIYVSRLDWTYPAVRYLWCEE